MKNITITVDPHLFRRARIYAAERDTTVTALIRDFLTTLTDPGYDDLYSNFAPPAAPEKGYPPPLFPVKL
jgi:hypothetical protein